MCQCLRISAPHPSLCTDTMRLTFKGASKDQPITLTGKGIAWSTDKSVKFKNPAGFSDNPEQGETGARHDANIVVNIIKELRVLCI